MKKWVFLFGLNNLIILQYDWKNAGNIFKMAICCSFLLFSYLLECQVQKL